MFPGRKGCKKSFKRRLCLSEVLKEEQALAGTSRMEAEAETSMCKSPEDGNGKMHAGGGGNEWLDKAGKMIVEGPVFQARSLDFIPQTREFEHRKQSEVFLQRNG